MISLAPFSAEWPAINALLDEALDLPPAEHGAWLASLSDEHVRHRDALRVLLGHRAEVQTRDFLGDGPLLTPGTAEAHDAALAAGTEIGVYRLIEEIGHGGMGTVWLAERQDASIARRIALKLPHRGLNQALLVKRLEQERRILAALEHPNIARLYDAGLGADGWPFMALEYVDGEAMGNWCDARQLPVADRLRIFLQVLAAVQYAHSNLVLHRDLKPSNVLVNASGQVKLLDFGIAKLLVEQPDMALPQSAADSTLTELGGAAMTPDYAAPEQLAGTALGTPCDIYTLGVLLYELLTGRKPYRLPKGSRAELERAIGLLSVSRPSAVVAEGAAADDLAAARGLKPQRLRKALQGDLDVIVLKALKKVPGERYATAQAFADDIERTLASQPIAARPDSSWYRLRKLVARNRLATAASALALTAVMAAAGVAFWQAHKANIEAQRAQLANRFVANLFAQNEPDALQGHRLTGAEMLKKGAEKLDTEFKDQPEALADLHLLVGKIYKSMDMSEEAGKHVDRALTLFRSLGDTPSVLDALEVRSDVAAVEGDSVGQRQLAQEGIDEARRYAGVQNRWEGSFRALLAHAAFDEGRFDDAERELLDTLRLEARLHGERSKEWLDAREHLALVYIQTGRMAQARDTLAQADRIASTTPDVPTSSALAISYDLALVRGMLGDFVGQESDLRGVVPRYERHLGPLHRETLVSKAIWSRALAELGRNDVALRLSREVLRLLPQSQVSEDVQQVLRTIAAGVLGAAGRSAEGLPIALEADRYFDSSDRTFGWNGVVSKRVAGELLLAVGRVTEALTMLQRAAAKSEAFKGAQQSPRHAAVLMSLGLAYRADHRLDIAESTMTKACSVQTAAIGGDPPPSLRCQALLAWIRAERAAPLEAEGARAAFSAARLAVERSLPAEHPLSAELLQAQADLLDASGRTVDAQPMHAVAQQRYRAAVGAELPRELTFLH